MTDLIRRDTAEVTCESRRQTQEEYQAEGKSEEYLVNSIKLEDSTNPSALLQRILLLITYTNQHNFQIGYTEKY